MNAECPHCGLDFQQEPGYYFGAMYFSYAINVAVMVAVWVAAELLFSGTYNVWYVVLTTIITGLLITPLNFRWSRLAWINLFFRQDKIK